MSLKASFASKAEVDALPEALRALYKAEGSAFVLDVEGMTLDSTVGDLNRKIKEFRDNNIELQRQVTEFKTKFEGVDPTKFRDLLSQEEQFKQAGLNKPNDLAAAIASAVEKATKPLNDKLGLIEQERDAANQKLVTKSLEDKLWQLGAKAGVEEWARPDFLNRGKSMFKLENDELVPVDAKYTSKRKNAGHLAVTPDEWATEWLPTETPGYFKASGGGGSQRQREQGGGSGARVIANDPLEIGKNLDAIASGAARVAD